MSVEAKNNFDRVLKTLDFHIYSMKREWIWNVAGDECVNYVVNWMCDMEQLPWWISCQRQPILKTYCLPKTESCVK